MNVQFKKGVLELCVLLMLEQSDCYGYELVSRISEDISISEGTIYPLLKRLKDEGYVTTYISESSQGPARKYYKLTNAGRTEMKRLANEWDTIVKGVNMIKQGGNNS